MSATSDDSEDRKVSRPDPKLTSAFELLRKIRSIHASNDEQADVYVKAFNAAAGRIRAAGPSEEATRELGETVNSKSLLPAIRVAAAQLLADQAKGRESNMIAWLDAARWNDNNNETFRNGILSIIATLHKVELDDIRDLTAAVKQPDGPKLNLNL